MTSVPATTVFDLAGPYAIGGLGTPFDGVPYGFLGRIDELAVYDHALEAAEIAAISAAGREGKCDEIRGLIPIAIANPSFELLTGTDTNHFDRAGKLLSRHYSAFPGSTAGRTGFFATDAIPGWKGTNQAGTINYNSSAEFPTGTTDGQNSAWVGAPGFISQTLPEVWRVDQAYHLSVDVGVPAGQRFPGYQIGIYAGGGPIAADTNRVPIVGGNFARIEISGALGSRAFLAGQPIEIRLGALGTDPATGPVVFDNIRLTRYSIDTTNGCARPPSGLVAWLRAEGTPKDEYSHASAGTGVRYAPGKVGQAFEFDGSNEVVLPDAPDLDGDTFTIESWVFPTVLDGAVNIIANKESGSQFYEFQYEVGIRGPVIDVPGTIPVGNVAFYLGGITGLPNDYGGWVDGLAQAPVGRWTHVALAVSPGIATVYVDGKATRRVTGLSGSLQKTPGPLKIGSRYDSFGARDRFKGRIDEFSFYRRALTDAEVFQAYQAGSAGKCTDATVPVVFGGPSDRTVAAGSDVEFSVETVGPYPVRIQWQFNGIEIPGATNGSLKLSAVMPSASGRYDVTVCNAARCAPAMAAVLQVIPDPCTPAPPGLVGWWRAEGDLKDQLGNGNGINAGSARIYTGFSGRGFGFSGTGIGVVVGNPVPFRIQDFTVESWIKRADARSASAGGFGGVVFSGGENSYGVAIEPDGELVLSWVGVSKVASTNRITDVLWHHIAVTKSSADVRFYIDGRPAGAAKYTPTFSFATPFAIGSLGATFGQNYTFAGELDEISLYARALTSQEIASVYQAGEDGKCINSVGPPPLVAPTVLAGPVDVTGQTGMDVAFKVVATGAAPLRYQWSFAGKAVEGATNDSLTLAAVQLSASGRYEVAVCNAAGCAPLTSATLQVVPASDGRCVPAPKGMVVQLRGEADLTEDFAHHVSATGIRYAEGKVGAAFLFDGTNEVVVDDAPDLDRTTFTIEAWVYPTALDGTVDIIVNKETRYPSVLTDIQFEIGVKGPLSDAPNSIPTGNLAFFLGGVDGLPNNYGGWTDAKASIPVATWTHVALVVEPGAVTTYVNGVATLAVNGLSGKLSTNTWPMKIGSRSTLYVTQTRPQDRFNGRIDEFSLYGRALTSAEIGSVFRAGSTGKCVPAYAPSIQAGPSDQTVLAGTDGRFSVVATGPGLLRYQWRFQDTDITGATNAQLLLPKVRRNAAGQYSVAVCNAAGCAPVVSATLSVDAPIAVVRIGDATAKVPDSFSVPVVLVGNGEENAIGFSVNFDPRLLTFVGAEGGSGASGSSTRLNRSQATNGSVGLAVGLQPGARFPRGTNELIRLRFQPKVAATEILTQVQITDSPAKRQLLDVDTNSLPVIWTGGIVRILATDFEGDVGPAPAGDHRVTAADWMLIGRYVAGLEMPADSSLFQRADCAPLSTGGNGRLTVGDWVQSGRFAVGLDPLTPATGPAAPVARTLATPGGGRALPQSSGPRVVSIAGGEFPAGQVKEVSVRLASSGDENAVGFSLRYDPTRLRFAGADIGTDATGATLNVNALQASDGRIGLALALPAQAKLAAGDIEVAKLRFAGIPGGTGPMDLAFSDAPVLREIASATAETLPSLWADTVFTVAARTLAFRIVQTADGPAIEVAWPADTTGVTLESAADPAAGNWSPVAAVPVDKDASRIVTLPLSATSSYYRLVVP